MPQTLWTCFLLIFLILTLTEASKKGKKGGSWNSNRNPNQPGGSWSGWNQGNTGQNWGQNYYPAGGNSYNNKQWKPPKSKTNMKMVAAGAAAGALGGFMLGNAVGNMRYHFDNDMESRYYNNYRNQMPNQVYRPMYGENMHVSQDRFVSDCFNMTVTEYVIKEDDGKNASEINQLDRSVKTKIIRELCVHEYQRGSGLRVLYSPILSLFVVLFVYFVVQ
ncbi:major prion homolog [Pelobates cultripes]|nr:major prion homolog [Pelobates cultripes]